MCNVPHLSKMYLKHLSLDKLNTPLQYFYILNDLCQFFLHKYFISLTRKFKLSKLTSPDLNKWGSTVVVCKYDWLKNQHSNKCNRTSFFERFFTQDADEDEEPGDLAQIQHSGIVQADYTRRILLARAFNVFLAVSILVLLPIFWYWLYFLLWKFLSNYYTSTLTRICSTCRWPRQSSRNTVRTTACQPACCLWQCISCSLRRIENTSQPTNSKT